MTLQSHTLPMRHVSAQEPLGGLQGGRVGIGLPEGLLWGWEAYKCELTGYLLITIIPTLQMSQLRPERSAHVPEVTQDLNVRAKAQTLA